MQPELFPAEQLDAPALAALAARSRSRADMQRDGWRPIIKSTDLFDLGYSILEWINPRELTGQVVEYNPITTGPHARPGTVRVTVECYEGQAAFHRAIGARVVGRGRRFSK